MYSLSKENQTNSFASSQANVDLVSTLIFLLTSLIKFKTNFSNQLSNASIDFDSSNQINYIENHKLDLNLPVALTSEDEQLALIHQNQTHLNLNNHFLDNHKHQLNFIFNLLISVILTVLIILTAVGNLFVIAAILSDRVLCNVQNYLVFSLALADLMVAILVMPLAAVYEIKGQWTLGVFLCDIWRWADILCCTSSILHLLAIAIDRYWAVNYVEYMRNRNSTKVLCLISSVWLVSLLISVGPLLGWKDVDFEMRLNVEMQCSYSQELSYQLFATISTFYAPLIFILLLYWRIFQVARKRIRNKPGFSNKEMRKTSKTNSNEQMFRKRASNLNKLWNKLIKKPNSKKNKKNEIQLKKTNCNNSLDGNNLIEQNQQLAKIGIGKLGIGQEVKMIDKRTIDGKIKLCSNKQSKCSKFIRSKCWKQENAHLIENPSASSQFDSPELFATNSSSSSNNASSLESSHCDKKQIIDGQFADEKLSIVIAEIENETSLKQSIISKTTTIILSSEEDELQHTSKHVKQQVAKPARASNSIYSPPLDKKLAAHFKQRAHQDSKRERKTAKVLAIITGVFIICWLPFFALTLLKALIPKYRDYNLLFSIFIWLGWANSMVNPIIYTIFSPDFRGAFKKLLSSKQRWKQQQQQTNK